MRRSVFLYGCIAAAMCLHTGLATSQSLQQREPGLWELRMDTGAAAAAMQDTMAGMLSSLPPAQRKQMEQMMKSSVASASIPDVTKQCLTPEMAARDFQPYMDDPDMTCTTTSKVVSSSAAQLTFSCSSPEGKMTGQGEIWDVSAKSYKSKMSMQGSVAGMPIKMNISHEGKWLGTDCQGIKPSK